MSNQPININLGSLLQRQPHQQRGKLQPSPPWIESLHPPEGFDGHAQWALQWISIGGLYAAVAQFLTVALPQAGIFVAIIGLCFVSVLAVIILIHPAAGRPVGLLLFLVIIGGVLGVLP